MKISFENVELGIAEYLDKELLSQYPNNSYHRVLIGMGLSLVLKQKLNDIRELLQNDTVKSVGIVDADGNIDVDLLRDTLKEQMTNEGIRYENKFIGAITFTKEDVDVLYKYLTIIR